MYTPYRIYNEEHEMFRQTVAEFAAKEIVPFNAEWEKNKMVSREIWKKLGDAGFLCMQVDEQFGGLGVKDFRYNAIFAEELAKTGCAGPAVGFPLHNDIVCPYIEHYGNEATKSKWLPGMVSGDIISAIAMTEPGAGSDLQGMTTTAEDKGDYYLLNGSKTFITNGYLADVVVVAAKTDPNAGAKGISLFVVDVTAEGFTKGFPFEKVGLHAQDTCELFFDNVKVPKDHLLGEEGKGFTYLMTELAQERLVVAITAVGGAYIALQDTIEYVKTRPAFKKTVADMQNTRFKLAECFGEIDQARLYMERMIELHADKKLEIYQACIAKQKLTDMQSKVADECMQLHGGYGYMWEYRVGRIWADARVQRIYAGTNEIMKEVIARKILS